MALSVVSISNIALTRIGSSRLVESVFPVDGSDESNVLNLHYEAVRDQVLEDFPWPFARKYATLGLIEEAASQPWANQWGFSYAIPSDCITIRRLATGLGPATYAPPPFEVGDAVILTNEAEAVAEYTYRVTDPAKFTPSFSSAVSWLLAHEIAMPLSVSDGIRERAMRNYGIQLSMARAASANHGQDPDPPESQYVRARD